MPNLYKMAKAFGKAMAQPDNPKMMDMISKGRIYSKKPENQAFRKAWDDEYKFLKTNEELPLREQIPDDDTEIGLQKGFDEAFEESFNKAKGTVNETMDKLGGYTPKDKEQAYDRLRQLMIDKLKNGESIEDVLDWGKNKSILIK